MSQVDETLAIWRKTTFQWGTQDCILAVCDHVHRVTGIDPAMPWRGRYSDEAGAEAIVARHGGLLGLFNYGMALAGFCHADPVIGSPVVAKAFGKECAGVYLGGRVAFLGGRGCVETRATVLQSWGLTCRR